MRHLTRPLSTALSLMVVAVVLVVAASQGSGAGLRLVGDPLPYGAPLPDGTTVTTCAPSGDTLRPCSCPPAQATPPTVATVPDGYVAPDTAGATSLRVATFNVLGGIHTNSTGTGGHDASSYPDYCTRMAAEVGAIDALDLDVVGIQELQASQQWDAFRQLATSYDLWPTSTSSTDFDGSGIAWNRTRWNLVPGNTCAAVGPGCTSLLYPGPNQCPANNGDPLKPDVQKPAVLLQSLSTGQQVWVLDTHHPAVSSACNSQNLRDRSVDVEATIIGQLRATYPNVPVMLTGDMNSSEPYFCRATARAGLISPAGGSNPGGNLTKCSMPANPQIDWIMSTPDVNWDGYSLDTWPQTQRETDHPLIYADAHIRPRPAIGINHVIVLDAEGLPADALSTRSGKHAARAINNIVLKGAGTRNARTVDSGLPLPNLTSILTGRPVSRALGGHGVKVNKAGKTLAKMGHVYSPSVFDRVHDYGGSTAFISSDRVSRVVPASYSARTGAEDTQGVSYGKAKLTGSKIVGSDAAVAASVLKNRGRTLTVGQFTGLRVAGSRYGYLSSGYYDALRALSRRIAKIVKVARATPGTLVILTADTGGHRHSTSGRNSDNYRVPFGVVGPNVQRGSLYSLSSGAFADPASARGGLGAGGPVHNGDLANLVTTVLGLPALGPLDQAQALNVFRRP